MKSALSEARDELLSSLIHTIGRVVLHITGDSRLSQGERRAAIATLRQLLEVLDKENAP